ncbi:MAG: DUF3078 domain-containing protein [Bacteroidaceae bacterium]|nr:DUF3078 domain-containing protein [Bacteroidaceae bacterium]
MKSIIFTTLTLLLCASFSVSAQQQDSILINNLSTAVNDTVLTNDTTLLSGSDSIIVTKQDSVATADTIAVSQEEKIAANDSIAGDSIGEIAANTADSTFNIKRTFELQLDSIIARYDTVIVDLSNIDGIERTNPTFIKLYMRPTLYRSTLGGSYSKDIKFDNTAEDTQMEADAKRRKVIDGMLLQLYRNNPSLVWATEDEIRKETTLSDEDKFNHMSGITLNAIPAIVMPESVTGDLKTKVVKPNYWRTYGGFGINYTQNFFSDNWHSGGENTKNMLVNVEFKLNYDDKKKTKFENHLEAKLGFYSSPSDTVHSIKTNQDLLRFTSKLNYQGVKDFYYTIQAQVWTQFLPSYDANQSDFRSNFMAPFNANFSFGIDYKPKISKGSLSVYLAPLSAYNYRFVRYGDLAVKHYGIRKGRHHFEDFGTKLEVNGTFQLFKNFSWRTRLYFYTTYSRVEHDWENTLSFSFNKCISASMFIHSRFDDKARSQFSDKTGYWQFYQNMMLGLTYSW